jgi:plastocyanin
MRKIVAVLAASALLIAAVTAYATTTSVSWKIGTNKTVKIKKGASVKWIWADGSPHNVKGPGFSSGSPVTKKGKTYTHRFTKKGTFKIICQVHPTSMKTVVKVL